MRGKEVGHSEVIRIKERGAKVRVENADKKEGRVSVCVSVCVCGGGRVMASEA